MELRGTTVCDGTLDGGPGPCFISTSCNGAPGLQWVKQEQGIKVELQGKEWFFTVRR